jgi:adenylate kinase
MAFMNIVIMGPQGSGKSTQGELLSKRLGVPHISTGAIFREIKASGAGDLLSHRVREQLMSGLLVDDTDALRVVDSRLSKEDCKNGFVLDGAPRDLDQAKLMVVQIDIVLYIAVSDAECIKRLMLRGREDDTEELINIRLGEYHRQTEPVLDYYRDLGKLIEINGEQTVDEIAEEVNKKIRV